MTKRNVRQQSGGLGKGDGAGYPRQEDAYSANLAHAKAAYENAQETIRFVDGKSGILTGIISVTTGLPFAWLQMIVSSQSVRATNLLTWYSARGTLALALTAGPMLAGVVFGALSLLASTNGLMARRPRRAQDVERGLPTELLSFLGEKIKGLFGGESPSRESGPPPTALFPYFVSETAAGAVNHFQRLGRGEYTGPEILKEYASQLESVGSILATKICRNREAVRWFEIQVVCYLFGISCLVGPILTKPVIEVGGSIFKLCTEHGTKPATGPVQTPPAVPGPAPNAHP